MQNINDMLLQLYVRATNQDAQGALEYMAMVVAMVTLIYIGFSFAGYQIQEEASKFVDTVINGRSTQ